MIKTKEKKKVGRMSRFLRVFAFLFVSFLTTNLFAAGYVCDYSSMVFTSCHPGAYLTYNGVYNAVPRAGNACTECPENFECPGGTEEPYQVSVTCEPGYYLPANTLTCEKCPAGKYCVGGTFNYPASSSNRGIASCPSPTTRVRTTYPTKYYGVPTLISVALSSWRDGISSKAGCVAIYKYNGSRGEFWHENVRYNATTDKYDNDTYASLYYLSPAAGYYLNERYDDTYCNTAGHAMLYRDALPCPAGKYCLGRTTQTACSSGTYETTLGIDGQVSAGYYSTGGATKAASTASNCVAGGTCGTIAAGYWGAAGATTSTGSGKIAAGYYSTGGGTRSTPTAAGNGCLTGFACGKVDEGYYSTGGGTKSTPSGTGGGCLIGFVCGKVGEGCYSTGKGSTVSCPNSCEDVSTLFSNSEMGSTSVNDCYANIPAGQYMPRAGYYMTNSCPLGSYSSPHIAHYNEVTSCTPCPAGTTTSYTGAISVQSCTACTGDSATYTYSWKEPSWNTGGYVDNLCAAKTCKSGSVYNESNNKCSVCPAGTWQSADNHTILTCSSAQIGYYVPTPGSDSQTPCPAGKYTSTESQSACASVAAGYYSTGGGTSATPTAAGNGCLSGYACGTIAAGYYSAGAGTTSTGSGVIAAGYYSTGGGTSATPSAAGAGCLSGYACGTLQPGYYSTGGGTKLQPNKTGDGCVNGYECGLVSMGCYTSTSVTVTSCPNKCSDLAGGLYSNSNPGAKSESDCYALLEGKYIASPKSGTATLCPVGRYKNFALVHYGSVSSCDVCPAGEYNTTEGEQRCEELPAGYWNNGCGTSSTGGVCNDNYSGGKVNAGYYSTGGGTSATPTAGGNGCISGKQCGPIAAGYWGAAGATTLIGSGNKVNAGYYSTGGGTSATPTAAGNGCISGKACGPVDAGYWNNGCGTSATGGVCNDNYSGGKVNAGYYSTGGGTSVAPIVMGTGCISGKQCGPIAAGYYGAAGATTSTGSGKVNAGYYSTGGGTSKTPTAAGNGCISGKQCGAIAAGYYGAAGATTSTGSGPVNPGYYSTGGGTSKTPTASGNGCLSGKQCGSVDAGYWNSGCGIDRIGNVCNDSYDGGSVDAGYWNGGCGIDPIGAVCDDNYDGGMVDAGYWNNGCGTSATADVCSTPYKGGQVDAGYYNLGGGTSATPEMRGKGCVNVSTTQCGTVAPGYWGAKGATRYAGSGAVRPGYYSTGGATSATPTASDCAGKVAIIENGKLMGASEVDNTCGQVQAGYWNNACGINATGGVCSTSYQGGIIAAGYWGTTGATDSVGSGRLAPGYYSTGGATIEYPDPNQCVGNNTCGAIAAGYWNNGGGTLAAPTAPGNGCHSDKSCGTVNAGYYSTGGGTSATPTAANNGCLANKSCGKLSAIYYSNGGSTSDGATCISGKTCGTCNANYRANTETGKTSASQCQASCAAGTRVATVNAACTSPAGGWFSAAHLVNYGQISPVNYCMSGYTSTSTSASGHDAKSDCVQTVAGGKYVPSSKINARYIKITSDGSVSVSGSTNPSTHLLEMQAFASSDGTGTNLLSGKGAVAGDKMSAVTNGNWTRGDGYSYGEGSPMILDLGSVQALGSLKFAMYTDGREYQNVAIAVSEDNTTYTTVFTANELLTQNTTTPTGELVVLSAAPKSCTAGTSKASGTVALGNTTTCGTCANWTYSGPGAASCTACPAVESGYAKLDSTGTGWTTYQKCVEIATASPTYCASGKLQKIPTASGATTWATATVNANNPLGANPGYYINNTECSPCGDNNHYCTGGTAARKEVQPGYYSTGGTSSATRTGESQCKSGTYCVSGVQKQCSALTPAVLAGTNGTFSSADGSVASTACRYTPQAVTDTECSSITANTVSYSGSAWGTNYYTAKAKAGAHVSATGNTAAPACELCADGTYQGTNGSSATTCGTCANWTYSGPGAASCTACPAVESGYAKLDSTGTGWTTYQKCVEIATASPTNCASGKLQKIPTASGATTWATATVNSNNPLNANPGYIVSGTMCSQCTGATYSAGGSATSCSPCDTNYQANTNAGKSDATQCQISCAAGTAVVEKNKACAVLSGGKYKTGTALVNYGSLSPTATDITSGWAVGTVYSCPSSYGISGTTAANHDARTDCTISCPAGTQVASENATCTTPSGTTWYTSGHSVAAGSKSGTNVKTCNSGYTTPNTTTQTDHDAAADCKISCDPGYYVPSAGQGCKVCAAGKYCTGASNVAQTATSDVTGDVMAGYYSSGGGTSETGTCLSGNSCGSCSTGTGSNGRLLYSNAGAASCSECPAVTGDLANRVTTYGGWWSNNIHNKIGGCYAYFSDSDDTATYRTMCYYNATDGTYGGTNSSCQVYAPTACVGGYYSVIENHAKWITAAKYASCKGVDCMKGQVCGLTDAGSYSPDGATTQTKCVIGSYTDTTGQSACKPCAGGKTNSEDGATSCTATCSNATGVASTGWETPVWGTDNKMTNLCTIKATAGCSANYYKNSNACSTCASGTNSKYTLSAAGTTTVNNCYLNTTAKNFVKTAGAGQTTCEKGNYCPGSVKVYYGGTASDTHPTTGGSTQCPANSYCVAGVSEPVACSTLGGGLYKNSTAGSDAAEDCNFTTTAGKYMVANTDTAQTTCPGKQYCEAETLNWPNVSVLNNGGWNDCPDAATHKRTSFPADYYSPTITSTTLANATGKTSMAGCTVLNWMDSATHGGLYEYVNFNTTTNLYDKTTTYRWLSAKPGYYLTDKNGCGAYAYYETIKECEAGSYCPGKERVSCSPSNQATVHTDTFGLNSCSEDTDGNYTQSSGGVAANSINACYLKTNVGDWVATANAAQTDCQANGYCPGNATVYYGSTGGRTACVAPYGLAAAGSDDANDCYLKTTAGQYVQTAGAGQVTCSAGSWCVGNVVIYKGGTVSGRATSGGSEMCPVGYDDGTTGYSLQSQCTMNVAGGKFVAVAKESSASGTCAKGYAKAAHPVTYGAISSCDPCTGATYAHEVGMDKCESCPPAKKLADKVRTYSYWISDNIHNSVEGCRVELNTTELTHGTTTGNGMRCKYVEADKDYGNGYCELTVSTMKCNPGYYSTGAANSYWGVTGYENLLNNACIAVEEGYYSPADSLTRTACETGLVTCGAGLCANEAGDCGRKLHAGNNVIYLRSGKRTGVSPLLHLKVGDKMFYGNMSTSLSSPLKVKYNNTKYSVVNDNQ